MIVILVDNFCIQAATGLVCLFPSNAGYSDGSSCAPTHVQYAKIKILLIEIYNFSCTISFTGYFLQYKFREFYFNDRFFEEFAIGLSSEKITTYQFSTLNIIKFDQRKIN